MAFFLVFPLGVCPQYSVERLVGPWPHGPRFDVIEGLTLVTGNPLWFGLVAGCWLRFSAWSQGIPFWGVAQAGPP